MKSKTIVITGTGASITQCDFVGDEVWGVNGCYTIVNVMPEKYKPKFRMDKLFITDHVFSNEDGRLNFDVEEINEFARKHNTEVLTLHQMKLGKHVLISKRIPYKQMCKYFGYVYFTDSICYMIAYALYTNSHLAQSADGVIRPELKVPLALHLYGIDMCTSREYAQSKGGVEHWLGVARGMGCEVIVSKGSAIMAHPMGVPYGWEKERKLDMKVIDPFGLLKGNKPTTAQMEQIIAKKLGRDNLKEARL